MFTKHLTQIHTAIFFCLRKRIIKIPSERTHLRNKALLHLMKLILRYTSRYRRRHHKSMMNASSRQNKDNSLFFSSQRNTAVWLHSSYHLAASLEIRSTEASAAAQRGRLALPSQP